MKRTTIYLSDKLHLKLKRRSVDEFTSMTQLIVEAIEERLKEKKRTQSEKQIPDNENPK